MRISIWQQFSSNHSSDFTVVGRFKTVEEAQKAEEQLRLWMDEIFKTGNQGQITEIERKIAQDYNIDWYEDGIRWNGTPSDVDDVIRRLGRDVFLICVDETWDSPIPFTELMRKLASEKVDYAEGQFTYLCVHLKFEAPDEETGKTFFTHTQNCLENDSLSNKPLWDTSIGEWNDVYWYGEIQKAGDQIQLRLQSVEVGQGLPELIDYLEQNSFKNLEYNLFQDREWFNNDWQVFNKPSENS